MMLGRMLAMGGAAEFVFNPLCGRLGDMMGRKPIIMIGLLVAAASNAVTFFRATSLPCASPPPPPGPHAPRNLC